MYKNGRPGQMVRSSSGLVGLVRVFLLTRAVSAAGVALFLPTACLNTALDTEEAQEAPPRAGTAGSAARSADNQIQPQSDQLAELYHHPLQGLQPIDGAYPFLDLRTSPGGNAYAIGEAAIGTVDGDELELFSGVIELERREMTAQERAQLVKPAPPELEQPSRLGPHVQELLASRPPTDEVEVQVRAWMQEGETVTLRVNRAIAAGLVSTRADREHARLAAIAEVRSETADAVAPVAAAIADLGGVVLYMCQLSPCVNARLRVGDIALLAERPDVLRIDAIGEDGPELHGGSINGQAKAQLYQTRMFWDLSYLENTVTYNYDGDNGFDADIRAAVMDVTEFRTTHVAFRESAEARPVSIPAGTARAGCPARRSTRAGRRQRVVTGPAFWGPSLVITAMVRILRSLAPPIRNSAARPAGRREPIYMKRSLTRAVSTSSTIIRRSGARDRTCWSRLMA
jgi:hypothetical protein